MASSRLSGPRFLEPHHRDKISERTLEKYKQELIPFTEWAIAHRYTPHTADEWDDLLVEYPYGAPYLSRGKFNSLVAGVEFFFQRLTGKLSWSHGVLSGWETGASVRHTEPLGKNVSKLISTHFAS